MNGNIFLYSVKPCCGYKFNINNVINSIKTYLNGDVLEYWSFYCIENTDKKDYGINIYKTLSDYVVNCFAAKMEIDQRFFYLIFDHKKMMVWRFSYLCKIGYNYDMHIDRLKEIERQSKIIHLLVLKYNLTKEYSIIESIVKKISDIEAEERLVLSDILN